MNQQFVTGGVCGLGVGLLVGGLSVLGWMQASSPAPAPVAQTQAAPIAQSLPATPKVVTQLGPVQAGEMLRVDVFDLMQPGRWSQELLTVNEAGEITVPGANVKISVVNLTISAIEPLVAGALIEANILPKNPPPTVRVYRVAAADGTMSPLFVTGNGPLGPAVPNKE